MTEPVPPSRARKAQTGVARGIGIGLGLTIAAAILGYSRSAAAILESRLTTLGIAALVLGLWLAAAIGDVARRRFVSDGANRRSDRRSLQQSRQRAALAPRLGHEAVLERRDQVHRADPEPSHRARRAPADAE